MTKDKVVLVSFPFDDSMASKVRPAVCLTNPIGTHQHVVVAFITSRVPAMPQDTDLVIRAEDSDFAATGLHVSSTVLPHRLMTLSAKMILREIGVLSPKLQIAMRKRLRKLFAL